MIATVKFYAFSFLLFFTLIASGQKHNYLNECWKKQVKSLNEQYLSFTYRESINELEHTFEPWQQTNYSAVGEVCISSLVFLKQDTMTNIKTSRLYYSKVQFNKNNLLFLDYGDEKLFAVTEKMFLDQTFKTARYSPILLLNYFFEKKIGSDDKESNAELAVYKTPINNAIIKLYIRKSDNILTKIVTLSDDELFGDVQNIFDYDNYSNMNGLFYPKSVKIEKLNGKIKEELTIISAVLVNTYKPLLDKPIDYIMKGKDESKLEIVVEKYSDNIYFIQLKHTDDKIMIVEFTNFLLVAEAPLNSRNGELIIAEAQKIAPNKPIRYFVFSHYHPHYTGGIRPFVHIGAKIICSKMDEEYITYLVNSAHTLNPDSLQVNPKFLIIESLTDTMTITDGKFKMKIYFIGNKSKHTNDYLIYYFPNEKLLFEGDLVWIPKKGEIKKASARQLGLYNAIKELNIDVITIIQSWPVSDYGVKTVIPFADLEQSINVK